MDEQIQISRIENYLAGKLSAEEILLFEAELASNPELYRLFLQHKYFLDGINGMKLQAFAAKLPQTSSPASHHKPLLYTIVAIAVLALLSIIYFAIRPSSMQDLANAYYVAPMAELQRSEGAPRDSAYLAGMRAFDQKNWHRAIAEFDQIEETYPFHEQIQYFKAHALIGDRRYADAHAVFSAVAGHDGQYAEQAEWNLVLTELFMDTPREEIIGKLTAIESQPNHFYREKASALHQQISDAR